MGAAIAWFRSSLQAQLDGRHTSRVRCLNLSQQKVNVRSRKMRGSSRFAQNLAERGYPSVGSLCLDTSPVRQLSEKKSTHYATAGVPGSLVGKRHPFCCGQSGASFRGSIQRGSGRSRLDGRHSYGVRCGRLAAASQTRVSFARSGKRGFLFASPWRGTVHDMR